MKFILKSFFAFTILFCFQSCTSDEAAAPKTNAKIFVANSNGPVSGISVYVFSEDTWNIFGEAPTFADGIVVTDNQGQAYFPDLEYGFAFSVINNYQNNMRFAVQYNLDGDAKTKVTAISFNKGESKTASINLD